MRHNLFNKYIHFEKTESVIMKKIQDLTYFFISAVSLLPLFLFHSPTLNAHSYFSQPLDKVYFISAETVAVWPHTTTQVKVPSGEKALITMLKDTMATPDATFIFGYLDNVRKDPTPDNLLPRGILGKILTHEYNALTMDQIFIIQTEGIVDIAPEAFSMVGENVFVAKNGYTTARSFNPDEVMQMAQNVIKKIKKDKLSEKEVRLLSDMTNPYIFFTKLLETLGFQISNSMFCKIIKQIVQRKELTALQNLILLILQQYEMISSKELFNSSSTLPGGSTFGGNSFNDQVEKYKKRLRNLDLPTKINVPVFELIQTLETGGEHSIDAPGIKKVLDFFFKLPWNQYTQDTTDFKAVQSALDTSHYGLEEVKEQIIDYLAVKQYSHNSTEQKILCLVGPPGIGKTSIVKTIAHALNKNFHRVALGGVHDEAAIRGHRRTYIGAMPGKILTSVAAAKTFNPVILLDEIDKIPTTQGLHGNPLYALLEVLDPEQNDEFFDNYLDDIPVSLQDVFFIATANYYENIPYELRDRMHIIHLPGYSEEEKVVIAKQHIIPKLLAKLNLTDNPPQFSEDIIRYLIRHYTMEAGVRTLSRILYCLCAKYTRALLNEEHLSFSEENISEHLRNFRPLSQGLQKPTVGAVDGLAYTTVGGVLVPIEIALYPGKGDLSFTGNVGKVMEESSRVALSYIKSHAHEFGIPSSIFTQYNIHIHAPEGTMPKDGPSAGVTLVSALVSSFTNKAVHHKFTMTGEIRLTGDVLPIGGVKEKLAAAFNAEKEVVFLPKANQKDYQRVAHLFPTLRVILVDHVKEILEEMFDFSSSTHAEHREFVPDSYHAFDSSTM